MYLLYSLVLSLLLLALLPYFVYQAARHQKYAGSFKQRMGWLPESLRGDGRKTIWVHAVSVGEFLAARPLIARLKIEMPGHRVVVSTATLTGQQLARSHSNLFDGAFYFPFDWKFSVRRTLDQVSPSLVIILETELWPNFSRECRTRGVVTVLANGRISPRSFRRYRLVRSFIKRVFEDFSLILVQSEADAERARQLGAQAARVRVFGNLKYDLAGDNTWSLGVQKQTTNEKTLAPRAPTPDPSDDIDRQFVLSSSPNLIVAGSTAPGEEELLLAVLEQVRNHSGLESARLLIAPRHPERFSEVASLIERSGLNFARRSQGDPAGARDADVMLLDTIGELASVYRFAAIVFVGGSLVPRGGHNVIEPAAFAKPIIVGPHTENFRQIVLDFVGADAVVQISEKGNVVNTLARELIGLLSDRERARALGERAREIVLRHRGGTMRTVAAIKEIMKNEG